MLLKSKGAVFDAVFDTLAGLEEDQVCRIKDFRTFKVKRRKARSHRLKTKKY